MKHAILKFIPLTLATAALSAGGATAQTGQTVAGAQEFMRLTLTNGSTQLFVPLANNSENYVQWTEDRKQYSCQHEGGIFGSTHCRDRVVGTRTAGSTRKLSISKVTKVDNCTTQISYWITPKYTNDITYVPGTATIYWRNVTEAYQYNESVTLKGQSIRLQFSSKDLATRFAYASTFLKNACDPTASTGF